MDINDGIASAAVVGYTNLIIRCLPDLFMKYNGTKVIISILCGMIYALQIREQKSVEDTLISGLMIGLLAAGGYSGGKALANK